MTNYKIALKVSSNQLIETNHCFNEWI